MKVTRMTREVIKTTTETRGRGALMQWEQSEQWWLSCSHTHTHTGWPVCGWATFDPSWEQSNTSLSHSPLFNPSSFSPSHTHTCRASVVRVREWPQSHASVDRGVTLGLNHTYLLSRPLSLHRAKTDSLKDVEQSIQRWRQLRKAKGGEIIAG